MYRIAVDSGGTFTDLIALSDSGEVIETKVPSNLEHPERALEAGLEELRRETGLARVEELLAQTRMIIQGTTVAINAVLQGTGVPTGLLCTRGFRDTLEIRLGYKEERYVFPHANPPLLVPRHLRVPIGERVDKTGAVRIPLDEAEVRAAAEHLRDAGVEAVAICFLWSFRHPAHEHRAAEIVREVIPGAFVTTSADVLPKIREYDRTSTTVLNATVGPIVQRYIRRTEQRLKELGFAGRIRYVQSNGGVAESAEVSRLPVLLLVSGPAAGPAAGLQFERLTGKDFIVIDMGGTSFDTCLVRDGLPDMRSSSDFNRYRVATPLIDVHTIGAGGGSIAGVDEGLLAVGPESAEANPGPACYLRGGTRPTVTDANVVAGLLNQTHLLGGRFLIDAELSRVALEGVAAASGGVSLEEAAAGVVEVVNRNMADAIREITVRRGHDPRDFSVIVGGGAGGVHAAQLAEELGIPRVVIPRVASALCAFGAAVADLRHDYTRSYADDTRRIAFGEVADMLDELESSGRRSLTDEGIEAGDVRVLRSLDIRYKDQVFECAVDVAGVDLRSGREAVRAIVEERFHTAHHALYDYSQPGYPCEVISATVTVIGLSPTPVLAGIAATAGHNGDWHAGAIRPIGTRDVRFDRRSAAVTTPVLAGDAFVNDASVDGPAIVEEPNTTIVVPPGWRVTFHAQERAYVLEPTTTR